MTPVGTHRNCVIKVDVVGFSLSSRVLGTVPLVALFGGEGKGLFYGTFSLKNVFVFFSCENFVSKQWRVSSLSILNKKGKQIPQKLCATKKDSYQENQTIFIPSRPPAGDGGPEPSLRRRRRRRGPLFLLPLIGGRPRRHHPRHRDGHIRLCDMIFVAFFAKKMMNVWVMERR